MENLFLAAHVRAAQQIRSAVFQENKKNLASSCRGLTKDLALHVPQPGNCHCHWWQQQWHQECRNWPKPRLSSDHAKCAKEGGFQKESLYRAFISSPTFWEYSGNLQLQCQLVQWLTAAGLLSNRSHSTIYFLLHTASYQTRKNYQKRKGELDDPSM